ncbi:MAG: hypothetical protein JRG73_11010 [Deltaproteobacteria bacterium]|nr:hypothetical protein [Deltaproteobacteria bacterium]
MKKAPRRPDDVIPGFVADCQRAFGPELLSIILYGSGATADYIPGKSDLNFLVVLTEDGIERLDAAFGLVNRWRKRWVTPPTFVTLEYVHTSLDSFPVEFYNMQRAYRVIYGEDVLANLRFNHEMLRLQVERDLKGKLLLLRQAFLEAQGRGRSLREVIGPSLSAFSSLFAALLFLMGREVPGTKRDILQEATGAMELHTSVFLQLLDIKEGRSKLSDKELLALFHSYLKEVRQAALFVDRWGKEKTPSEEFRGGTQ